MTVAEIFEQAKSLTVAERRELAKLLIDTLDPTPNEPLQEWKTGADIVAMIEAMGTVEFVDDHIDDPVEWLQVQRTKRKQQLFGSRDNDDS